MIWHDGNDCAEMTVLCTQYILYLASKSFDLIPGEHCLCEIVTNMRKHFQNNNKNTQKMI